MFANQHFGMLLPPRPPPPSLPHNHIHPQNHRQEDQYQVSYKGGPPPSASAFVTTTVTLSATGIPDEPEGGGMDPEPEQRMVERSMEDDGKVIETVEMLGEEQTVVEPVQHGLEKRNVCPACPASAGVKNEYNGGPSRDSATGRPCCPARKTLLKTKLVRRTTIRRVFKTRVVKSTTTVSITPPPFNITGSLIEEVDGVDGPAVDAPIEIQLVSQPNVTATGRLEKRFFRTIARARTNLFGAFVFSLPRLIPQTVIRIIASIDNSVIGTFIAGVDGMIPVNGFPGTVRKPARLPLLFETPGTYQWQAPFGVTSISVACVGGGAGGGGGNDTHAGAGGGGAGLGNGGDGQYLVNPAVGNATSADIVGDVKAPPGGGGAGGSSYLEEFPSKQQKAGAGGGVGLQAGEGASGVFSGESGSIGPSGGGGGLYGCRDNCSFGRATGGNFGGGGGHNSPGGTGACRIMWGDGISFPNNPAS